MPQNLCVDQILLYIGNQSGKERTVCELILGLFDIIKDSSYGFEYPDENNPSITTLIVKYKYEFNGSEEFPKIKRNSEYLFLNKAYELL